MTTETGSNENYCEDKDILRDVIHNIATQLRQHKIDVPAEVLDNVNTNVRNLYGGDRWYVNRRGESISLRNQKIHADWCRGEHFDYLAKKHGLTIQHIRRIVHCQQALAGRAQKKEHFCL